jgi:hypothetical protein
MSREGDTEREKERDRDRYYTRIVRYDLTHESVQVVHRQIGFIRIHLSIISIPDQTNNYIHLYQ